jgi:hypothetical protein
MGAWGTGAFDNDDAGDFMLEPEAIFASKLRDATDVSPAFFEEGRAALAALAALDDAGYAVSIDTFADGEMLLERMLDAKDWLAAWRSPKAIRERIRRELLETKARIKRKRKRAIR